MSSAALSCGRCSSLIEPDDLRCPVCNLSCPGAAPKDLPATQIEILRCSGCGAAMTYEVKKRAASCAFCGSVLAIEQPADPLEEARWFLPFTIDRERAANAFRGWLGSLGWFRPGDLRSDARLETIEPLLWVGWVFDARAEISWAADTDLGSRRSDWAPHAGRTELEFDAVAVPATRGLSSAEAELLVPSYDLNSATESIEEGSSTTIERFDIPRSVARKRLIEVVEQLSRRRLTSEHIPGNRIRNLRTSTILRGLAARRVAFPAWVLAYRYKGRLFRTVLSGQDADCLKGEAPYSAARIAVVIAGAVGAVVALLALIAS